MMTKFLDMMKSVAGIVPVENKAVSIRKEPSWIGSLARPSEETYGVRQPYAYLTDEQYYGAHPWVYQAVFVLSTKIAEVPMSFFMSMQDGQYEKVNEHEFITLLDKPNPYQSTFDLIEAIVSHMELTGNAYLELVMPEGKDAGPPAELWPIRSDRVTVVPGTDKLVAGYLVKVGNDYYALPSERVVHFKYNNPFNDYYGIGPLQAVTKGLVSDLYAMDYNYRFFENAGRPDGILSTDQDIMKEDADRLRLMWRETHGGYERAHRIAVLGKGATYQQIGLSQADMEFIELRKMTREEILAVFGVPPVMVGLLEHASYANAEKQEKIFYQVSIIPRLIKLQQALTNIITMGWPDDNIVVEYDVTEIQALKDDMLAMANVGEKLIRSGQWSPNEVRQELWMRAPYDGGDTVFTPAGLMPAGVVGKSTNGVRRKTLSATIKREMVKEHARQVIRTMVVEHKQLPNVNGSNGTVIGLVNEERISNDGEDDRKKLRDAVWASMIKKLVPREMSLKKVMERWFAEQKERYVKHFEDNFRGVGGIYVIEKTLLPPEDEEINALSKKIVKPLAESVKDGGGEALGEMNINEMFNLLDPEVVRFLEHDKSKGLAKVIEKETRKIIDAEIASGIAEGFSSREIAIAIRRRFNTMSTVRSARIARTETAVAFNFGKFTAYKQNSQLIEKKEWVSSRDADVRETHQIDGEKHSLNAVFSNGLMYPGENGGPPEEIINCRCTMVTELKQI